MESKKSMGKLMKAGCLLILVIIFSCDTNINETWIDYVVFNNSGVTITLKSYSGISSQKTRTDIIIPNNDAYSENVLLNGRDDKTTTFTNLFKSDSVAIIFDSTRKITYYFTGTSFESNIETGSRNILTVVPEANTERAEYTFSVNDFDNALPCESGTCD